MSRDEAKRSGRPPPLSGVIVRGAGSINLKRPPPPSHAPSFLPSDIHTSPTALLPQASQPHLLTNIKEIDSRISNGNLLRSINDGNNVDLNSSQTSTNPVNPRGQIRPLTANNKRSTNTNAAPSNTTRNIPLANRPRPPKMAFMDEAESPKIRIPLRQRPKPPDIRPSGIPDDQPLPPEEKLKEVKPVPAAIRPAPKLESTSEVDVVTPRLAPPSSEPPTKRGKKKVVKVVTKLKRRDRENPEFESSEDEEDEKKDFDSRAVKLQLRPYEDFDELERETAKHLSTYQVSKSKPADSEDEDDNDAEDDESLEIIDPDDENESTQLEEPPITENTVTIPKLSGYKTTNELTINTDDADMKKVSIVEPLRTGRHSTEIPETGRIDETKKSNFERTLTMKLQLQDEADLESITSGDTIKASVAGVDKTNTDGIYVPPPPDQSSFSIEDSRLAQLLPRGRLIVRCIEATGVRKIEDPRNIYKNNVYARFRLGSAMRHPWKSTAIYYDQGEHPKLGDELVAFDVIDVRQFIYDNELELNIELMHHNKNSADEVLGIVSMSVVRFFQQPFTSFQENIPLRFPDAKVDHCKLKLDLLFEEAKSGMFLFTIYEANDLRILDPLSSRQDPYVQLSLGEAYVKKTKKVKNGGENPYFNEEELLMWMDGVNWSNDLIVSVLDAEYGDDKAIGSTHLSLLPYMNSRPELSKRDTYDLFFMEQVDVHDPRKLREVSRGTLDMMVTFLPAGKLTVTVHKALGLHFPSEHRVTTSDVSRLDAYVSISIDGIAVDTIKQTPIDKDGGHDPVWNYPLEFDIVDQYMVKLKVFHQISTGTDILLGEAEFSLLTVFRNGQVTNWVQLKQKSPNGGTSEIGNVYIDLKFNSLPGIAYPQYRNDVDKFDDTVRKILPPKAFHDIEEEGNDMDEDEVQKIKIIDTIPNTDETADSAATEEKVTKQGKSAAEGLLDDPKPEFTEEEIIGAFRFIDLNHNNYIGAAEIRHILICMGELITDEEIDMMIKMVDLDGDGQVSYQEFRTLVLHPNPDKIDLHKETQRNLDKGLLQDKMSNAGVSGPSAALGLDLNTFQRQKELNAREIKKVALINFIDDYELKFDDIKSAYEMYTLLPAESKVEGRVVFTTFCEVLSCEPIAEYHKLFNLFDKEEIGTVDFREFILSILNFIDVNRDDRIHFSFTMFDDQLTGYISKRDIIEILRGNHMVALTSVLRKADTIMKQAAVTPGGLMTLNEFIVISKKFPNILIPSLQTQIKK